MRTLITIFVLTLFVSMTGNVSGQLKLKDKLKKVEGSVDQRTDQGIEKGLDKAQEKIGNLFKKKEASGQSQQEQQEQQNQEGNQATDQNVDQAASPHATALEAYSKYDFIPGEKVIFFEDFSQDAIGDFPALWNTNGSAEVVTNNLFPGNWMKFSGWESIWTDELLQLPENYTIEFDLINLPDKDNNMPGCMFRLMQAKNVKSWDGGTAPGMGGFQFHTDYGRPFYSTWLFGAECSQLNLDGFKDEEMYKEKMNQKYHIAIWVQKSRLRLYQDELKVFDIPKAFPTGCVKPDRIRFERGTAMVSNIRIAVGAPDTRNKLLTEGKLVTYGIYFDVNKDVVKPESYGTLKDIAKVLQENPEVRVKIVGHTDSDGADAANLDLSVRRGASVKNELVNTFGIEASRLESDGMGESQPVAANDTPANKALNRRVEFIKL